MPTVTVGVKRELRSNGKSNLRSSGDQSWLARSLISNVGTLQIQIRFSRSLECDLGSARRNVRETVIKPFCRKRLSMPATHLPWEASSSLRNLLRLWTFIALAKPKGVSNIFLTKQSPISKPFENLTSGE